MPSILMKTIKWLLSRVWVIYVVVFIFCLSCIDLKNMDLRVKLRHLNSAIPDFSDMITFSKYPGQVQSIDWAPYKDYFELILRFMPDDVVGQQLLGFTDYYLGQQDRSIELFKKSSLVHGQDLFFSDYNLGVIYYKKGMWAPAADYLLKAVAANPQLSFLITQNATVYKQIFASPAFRYSLSGSMAEAQSDAYILLLSSMYSLGQYDKMLLIATNAIARSDLRHKDAFYYYAGLGFLGMRQLERSYMFFQKSLSLQKNNPDVYFYIADIYQKTGQGAQARNFLQASYALHQKNDQRFPYDKNVNLQFF